MRPLVILLAIILLNSCSKSEVSDLSECDQLAMEKFKGLPFSASKFNSKCQNATITYTSAKCQKAFVEFTMGAKDEELKAKYGKHILNCFTGDDRHRFSPKR